MNTMTSPNAAPTGLDYLFHKWRARLQLFLGLQTSAIDTFEFMRARWPDDAYALDSLAHLAAQDGHLTRAVQLPVSYTPLTLPTILPV